MYKNKFIKTIYSITLALVWSFSCLHGAAYTHDFAVCAIFKNEAPYLKEWIEYHKLVGAEHFYLYNNESEDNYLEVLTPYLGKRSRGIGG